MIEDGYIPGRNGSMNAAAMAFRRDHGLLKDIYSESDGPAHKTAKGSKVTVRTVKAPGFGPKGVLRCILPYTIFLKLRDIGGVLPPYDEEFREVAMSAEQGEAYQTLASRLTQQLQEALRKRDTTLLGVVLNDRPPRTCQAGFQSFSAVEPSCCGFALTRRKAARGNAVCIPRSVPSTTPGSRLALRGFNYRQHSCTSSPRVGLQNVLHQISRL